MKIYLDDVRLRVNSKIYDQRDYFKRQEHEAVRQMVALPEGLEKQSAEGTVEYFRTQFFHYNALCNEAKP